MSLADVLRALPGHLKDQRLTLGDILLALDEHTIPLMLLIFAIPAIVPTPGIPAGMLFGSALAVIGLQMAFGAKRFWLPSVIARRRIARVHLERVIHRTVPQLEKLERRLRVRAVGLAYPRAARALGVIVFVMAVLIALPIPFGNTLPGLAVFLMALGLAQQDGLAIMAGLGLAVAAGIVSTMLIGGSWWLIESALGTIPA